MASSVVLSDGAVGVLADGAEAVRAEDGVCAECCGGAAEPGILCCQDVGNGSNGAGPLCGAWVVGPEGARRLRYRVTTSGTITVNGTVTILGRLAATVAHAWNFGRVVEVDQPYDPSNGSTSFGELVVSETRVVPYGPGGVVLEPGVEGGIDTLRIASAAMVACPFVPNINGRLYAVGDGSTIGEEPGPSGFLQRQGPSVRSLAGALSVAARTALGNVRATGENWEPFRRGRGMSVGGTNHNPAMCGFNSIRRAADRVGRGGRVGFGSIDQGWTYDQTGAGTNIRAGASEWMTAPPTIVDVSASGCTLSVRLRASCRVRAYQALQDNPGPQQVDVDDTTVVVDLSSVVELAPCGVGRQGLGEGGRSALELLRAFGGE